MNTKTVTYNGNKYTAEFCLDSLCAMEEDGFSVDNFDNIPFSTLVKLVHGAFYMHHPELTTAETNDIYMKGVKTKDKKDFVNALVDMYMACARDVMGDEGNEIEAAG